jgi:hypothetical protein
MNLFVILMLLQDKPSSIEARINGEIITKDDLAGEVRKAGAPRPVPEDLRKAILRQMATRKLMLQEAKRLGVKVDDKDVEAAIERDIQNFKGEENFQSWLARRGMTRQQHREERRQILLQQRLISMKYYLWIQDPTSDSPPIHEFVTPTELRNYYQSNRREFDATEYIKLGRITFQFSTPDEKKEKMRLARSILRRIEVGTDFLIMAQINSEVKGAPFIENFGRSNTPFSEGITDQVMKMEKGQTSDVLEDKASLHIVKVLDKIVRNAETFEEAQPRIRTILEYEKRKANETTLMKELIRNAYFAPKDLFEGLE